MQRIAIQPRPDWQAYAKNLGFQFHTMYGQTYWDESAYYQFSLRQIEQDLEAVTEELHAMALDIVPDILADEHKLDQLAIPVAYRDALAASWRRGDPYLYGRMDLVYAGDAPAKLLELNYDTPTALYESGVFQWVWLEDMLLRGRLPQGADQFNSLHDQLEAAFTRLDLPQPFYFTSVRDGVEDKGTVDYLLDIATQNGIDGRYIALEDIGSLDGQYYDLQGQPITGLFKLYPWEFLLSEDFACDVLSSQTLWLEPLWKLLLSNKGILPLLWHKHRGHPNLLESHFDEGSVAGLQPGWVRKPLFSREGANVELITSEGKRFREPGPYADAPLIRQRLQPLPCFAGHYALIGSWVVGDSAAGIGIREDHTLITKDSARFVPHIILDEWSR